MLNTITGNLRIRVVTTFRQAVVQRMASTRAAEKVFVAQPQREGVGATVRRSIGSGACRHFDPFLLLDEFSGQKPGGFPSHPHRGLQTVTYMLRGAVEHRDNRGHHGIIRAGDVQWMTAGRGIVHSEMPHDDGLNEGLQLWVNLAAKDKMVPADYQEIPSAKLERAVGDNGKVEVVVVAGTCYGVTSTVFTLTPTLYFDVKCEAGAVFEQDVPAEFNVFVYVLSGDVYVGEEGGEVAAKRGACALLGDGDKVRIRSETQSRLVVIGGKPLNEPIVQHGPFVMNTRAEISRAIRDYTNDPVGFGNA